MFVRCTVLFYEELYQMFYYIGINSFIFLTRYYIVYTGFYHIYYQENDKEIKEMNYEAILKLSGCDNVTLYFYPKVKV